MTLATLRQFGAIGDPKFADAYTPAIVIDLASGHSVRRLVLAIIARPFTFAAQRCTTCSVRPKCSEAAVLCFSNITSFNTSYTYPIHVND